jgi:hypothetical protein
MPTLTPNVNALRRITFLDLARVLNIPPLEMRGLVNSRSFPRAAGIVEGDRVWRVADVCFWLESNGWRADAEAVRNFSDYETE